MEVQEERKTGDPDEVEVESRTTGPEEHPEQKKQKTGGSGGGASIEVGRRPRGRPRGSKNKPKPPVVVSREAGDSAAVTRAYVLEISAGCEVVDALSGFCRCRGLGLSVIAAMGAVSNVVFRDPDAPLSPATAGGGEGPTFPGRFDVLSMSGTFLRPSFRGTLSITLAGPHGQVLGGTVVGPLAAAGTVTVIAAAFTNPNFSRLPEEEDVSMSASASGDGARREDREDYQQQQHGYHGHHRGGGGGGPVSLSGTAMYSCHLPSDVIWMPPSARTTHRPPFS